MPETVMSAVSCGWVTAGLVKVAMSTLAGRPPVHEPLSLKFVALLFQVTTAAGASLTNSIDGRAAQAANTRGRGIRFDIAFPPDTTPVRPVLGHHDLLPIRTPRPKGSSKK